MTRLIICGQAPSRVGDGRPFTGPSGRRLAALMMLRDYEHLASQFTLANIFDQPMERREDRGDYFDMVEARRLGVQLMGGWAGEEEPVVVLACGHAVFEALTGSRQEFYHGKNRSGVEVWCFPHPSGASAYWNRRANVLQAANFLRRLLKRSGISIER